MIRYKHVHVAGVRVFYREAGDPRDPALLLLHGFPSSSHMFRDLLRDLEDRLYMIAPDYPGFGYSDAPAPGVFTYSFDALAAIVGGFVEALGLDRFGMYVQDYGGPVGFRLARRRPEVIRFLVVQNAVAHTDGFGDALAPLVAYWRRSRADDASVRPLLDPEMTRYQYTEGAGDLSRVSPDAWTHDQALLDRPGNDRIQLDLLHDYQSNVHLYPQWQAYLREHRPPTLIVWGQGDPIFTVPGARAYLRDLPDAELHLVDSGHFALEDQHELIAAKIRSFLDRHGL